MLTTQIVFKEDDQNVELSFDPSCWFSVRSVTGRNVPLVEVATGCNIPSSDNLIIENKQEAAFVSDVFPLHDQSPFNVQRFGADEVNVFVQPSSHDDVLVIQFK